MERKRNPARGWWAACLLAAIGLGVSPADAGGKGRDKKEGGISPSNIAVVDSDLEAALAEETEFCIDDDAPSPEEQIRAAEAHECATGRGVVVAILDGGFNLRHPEIAEHLLPGGYDAIDGDDNPEDLGNGVDDDRDGVVDRALGHGTFVAGMVLRAAPDAILMPIRVRDDEGRGTNKQLLAGLDYAVRMGADVINLSVTGAEAAKRNIKRKLAEARMQGCITVTAAGNDGETDSLPQICRGWRNIAAGSVDSHDRIAEFSNYTPWTAHDFLLVYAPGVDLHGPIGAPDDDSCGTWSGTSFSAGYISGAVALALELHPGSGPEKVMELLDDAVDPIVDRDGRPVPNAGRIDLSRVVSR